MTTPQFPSPPAPALRPVSVADESMLPRSGRTVAAEREPGAGLAGGVTCENSGREANGEIRAEEITRWRINEGRGGSGSAVRSNSSPNTEAATPSDGPLATESFGTGTAKTPSFRPSDTRLDFSAPTSADSAPGGTSVSHELGAILAITEQMSEAIDDAINGRLGDDRICADQVDVWRRGLDRAVRRASETLLTQAHPLAPFTSVLYQRWTELHQPSTDPEVTGSRDALRSLVAGVARFLKVETPKGGSDV